VRQFSAIRAKAFTDMSVGGHDGEALGVSDSPPGHHGEASCSLPRGTLWVKTLSVLDMQRRRLRVVPFLEASYSVPTRSCGGGGGCCLEDRVVEEVLRAHGCWRD
jgi:hypothetical protein